MVARVLRVHMLGTFAVEIDGRRVPSSDWQRRQPAALVKMLALAPRHRLTRDEIIEALWPHLELAAAKANLRKAAHRARRTLGADDAIVLQRGTVALLPSGEVFTDVEAFEQAARAALPGGDEAAARRAVSTYGGELLPDDRYEPWCEERRRSLEVTFRELLIAGRLWGRLVAVDPLNELAHRRIIRARLDAGDRAGAIRQFDELRRSLRDGLGVSPDPDSIALYEEVLAHEGRAAPSPAQRARTLLAWGMVHWERADLRETEETAAEVRALALDAGLGRELSEASELLGLVAYAQGRWREVFASAFLEALRTAPEMAGFVYDANLCMAEFALHERQGLAHIADFAGQLIEAAREEGSLQARALGLLLRGEVGLLSGGDPDDVAEDLRASLRLHETVSSPSGSALAAERLAQVEAFQHGAEGPARHRRALELAEASPVRRHLLPLVFGGMLQSADPAGDVDVLEEADAALADVEACRPCSMPWHLGAAMAHVRRGDFASARGRLDQARAISTMWADSPWHSAVRETEAAIVCAEGAAPNRVRSLLETALSGFEAAGRHRDAARCRSELAALG